MRDGVDTRSVGVRQDLEGENQPIMAARKVSTYVRKYRLEAVT